MKSIPEMNRLSTSRWKSLFNYFGWFIGLLGTCTTIYLGFFQTKDPGLEYEIVSSTDFINNQETSANLKIFVDTLDVQENHLNITAYNIKVENKGTKHIRYDDYDKGKFGLKILDGKLLESPILLDASTIHIRERYAQNSDSLNDGNFVAIPTLSLDVNDNYTIRVVLLHNAEKIPQFLPNGKIIGQKTIEFCELQTPNPKFWTLVFYGKWYVHVVRFLIYLIITFLVCFAVAITGSFISDILEKRERRKFINELNKKKKIIEFVKDEYIEKGVYAITLPIRLYKQNESDINTQYKKSKEIIKNKQGFNNSKKVRNHRLQYEWIQEMIDRGYLDIKEDGGIVFNKEAKQSVLAIYGMLKSKGLLRSKYPMGYDLTNLMNEPYLD